MWNKWAGRLGDLNAVIVTVLLFVPCLCSSQLYGPIYSHQTCFSEVSVCRHHLWGKLVNTHPPSSLLSLQSYLSEIKEHGVCLLLLDLTLHVKFCWLRLTNDFLFLFRLSLHWTYIPESLTSVQLPWRPSLWRWLEPASVLWFVTADSHVQSFVFCSGGFWPHAHFHLV